MPNQGRSAAERLRKFWKLGHDIVPRFDRIRRTAPGTPGAKAKQQFLIAQAEMQGCTDSVIRQQVVVARTYTRAAMESLCDLVELYGAPFGPAHLVRCLSLPKADQQVVLHQAVKSQWSCAELAAHIRLRYGTRRQNRGRKPAIPKSRELCLVQLSRQASQFTRWYLAARIALGKGVQPVGDLAVRHLRHLLKAADAQLDQLQSKANRRNRL